MQLEAESSIQHHWLCEQAMMLLRPPAPCIQGACPQGYNGFQPPWPSPAGSGLLNLSLAAGPLLPWPSAPMFTALLPSSCTSPKVSLSESLRSTCAGKRCTPKLTLFPRHSLTPQSTLLRCDSTQPSWVWHPPSSPRGWRPVPSHVFCCFSRLHVITVAISNQNLLKKPKSYTHRESAPPGDTWVTTVHSTGCAI